MQSSTKWFLAAFGGALAAYGLWSYARPAPSSAPSANPFAQLHAGTRFTAKRSGMLHTYVALRDPNYQIASVDAVSDDGQGETVPLAAIEKVG